MSTANPLGDLVILMSFLACWQGAGMSGRAAMREIQRRQRRKALPKWHHFEAFDGSSGMVCTAMVTSPDGSGDSCGRPASDAIHVRLGP